MTKLIAANPIRVRCTPNVMCHSLPRQIDGVSAEIRTVTLECRSDFRICAALRIVGGKEGPFILHNMRRHVAGGIIDEQTGHVLS
jgi:hypothetical protein